MVLCDVISNINTYRKIPGMGGRNIFVSQGLFNSTRRCYTLSLGAPESPHLLIEHFFSILILEVSVLHQRERKALFGHSVSHSRNSFSASAMTGNRQINNYLTNEKLVVGIEKNKAKK